MTDFNKAGQDPSESAEAAKAGFSFIGANEQPPKGTEKKAYYIHLEAKPGKGDKVKAFLRDINQGVDQEPSTGPWFGMQYSDTTFAIFEAFPDYAGREAHNIGPGGNNFLRTEELHDMLAYPARIYRLDIMHGKFDTFFGKHVTLS